MKKVNSLYWVMLIIALAFFGLNRAGYWLTYQGSISMPRGFYWVVPAKNLHRDDIVVFSPSVKVLSFLFRRHWIPSDGILMKYVFAVPGDHVCTRNGFVWVNNQKKGKIYQFYAPGKVLPRASFCRSLEKGEFLLMSNRIEHSFDGRYFGPVRLNRIYGKALPL